MDVLLLLATTSFVAAWGPSFAVILVFAVGGLATYWQTRHAHSGKIQASQATDLWKQTQTIMQNQAEAITKIETQRDKLLGEYQQKFLPLIESWTTTLKGLSVMMDEVLATLREKK